MIWFTRIKRSLHASNERATLTQMIRIKTAKQITGIRESCHLLAEVLELLENAIQPGITTIDLDEIAKCEISSRGGRPAFLGYQGFPGALCTSVNEEVIHGIPSNRRLNEGDIVSIDCGIEYNGYYSDSAAFRSGRSDISRDNSTS